MTETETEMVTEMVTETTETTLVACWCSFTAVAVTAFTKTISIFFTGAVALAVGALLLGYHYTILCPDSLVFWCETFEKKIYNLQSYK